MRMSAYYIQPHANKLVYSVYIHVHCSFLQGTVYPRFCCLQKHKFCPQCETKLWSEAWECGYMYMYITVTITIIITLLEFHLSSYTISFTAARRDLGMRAHIHVHVYQAYSQLHFQVVNNSVITSTFWQ